MSEKQEILLQIKWLIISLTICALIGALVAGIKVMFFEQTPSGRYAVYNECVEWNEDCVNNCQEAQRENPQRPPSCGECCIQYKDVVSPLGKRISEVAKLYALYGGSIGIVIGLANAEEKKRKIIRKGK